MIARVWHGRVPTAKSEAYLDLMQTVALPEYHATPGNRGAWCLRRNADGVTHFEMLTFWDGVEAIRRFAGDDVERAKYYDFDAEFLLEFEEGVRHYELHGG